MPSRSATPRRHSPAKRQRTVSKKKSTPQAARATGSAIAQTTRAWRPMLRSFSMHAIVAGSAALVLVVLGTVQSGLFSTSQSHATQAPAAAIAITHEGKASIDLLLARKGDAGYLSLENRSPVSVDIGLPADWQRTEVRGTDLESVHSSIPSFGFRTWTLPAGAGMKMLVPEAPRALLLENRSDDVAIVTLQGIDLVSETRTSATVLLQHQPSLVQIWEQ